MWEVAGGVDLGAQCDAVKVVAQLAQRGVIGGEAGGVVADSGAKDAGAFRVFDGGAGRSGAEDGVKVRGDEDAGWGRRLGVPRRGRFEFREDVAFFVQVAVGEAEPLEAVEKPCGAGLLRSA